MVKVPSAFKKAVHQGEKGIFWENALWKIGDVSTGSYYPRDIGDLIRYYPLVIKWAKQEGHIKDDSVAISLPAETYINDKRAGGKLLEQLSDSIKAETGISAVVLPQGPSGLIHVIGEGHLQQGKYTLVIDGGFNTVNVVLVDEEGNIVYTRTYYNEFGIRNLIEGYFYPLLAKYNLPRNLQVLKDIFLKGYFDIGLERTEISAEKQEAINNFISTVLQSVIGDLKISGLSFDQFAVIGGLSYYLDRSAIQTNKQFYIPTEGGEFINALGMKRHSGLTSVDFGFGDIKIV
ncbi:hypothetical protein [Persephonella sp.]